MRALLQRRSVAAIVSVVGAGVIMTLFLVDQYRSRRAPTRHATSAPFTPRAIPFTEPLEPRRLMAATLQSSTYVGGNGDDAFRDAVVAPDGSVYLAGASFSTNLPLPPGGYDRAANGAGDSLVVRLTGDLSAMIAGTLLGGSGWEKNTYGIGLDAQGNVYVAGETRSTNFPTTAGALQRTFGGGESDAFVAKLDRSLANLLYATYLGGGGIDAARGGLAVDPGRGEATVVGWTGSTNFPTTAGSYQSTYRGGTYDGFVTRLSSDGGSLLWSTFVGGSFGTQWFDSEYVVGATLGTDGSVYFTGSSTSSDFPTTPGAYDRTHGGSGKAEAFVGRMSADGKALLWSTLLGGTDSEFTEHRIAQDAQGNIVIVGTTQSHDFPVTTGRSHGGGVNDVFVAKVSADGTRLLWSTLVGGGGGDSALGPVIGPSGDVYVAGETTSGDFPVSADAQQHDNAGGQDAVLVRLDGATGQLKYATYLGGSGDDYARYVAGDGNGRVYVTGETSSRNYPTTSNALQQTFGGGAQDAFVTQLYFDDDTGTGNPKPAEVNVLHEGSDIQDDATAPVSFGTAAAGTAPREFTFTVSNSGEQDLVLGTLALLNNTGFEVVRQPDATVAPGGSTAFVLRMLTGTPGSVSADVRFDTNDADENPFDFAIVGTITGPPSLTINGTPGADTVYVKRSGNDVHVWLNSDAATAAPTHAATLADLQSFSLAAGEGDDVITLDFSAGDPIPSSGLALDAGAGVDRLAVIDTAAADAIAFDGRALSIGAANVAAAALESLDLIASGGADALSFGHDAVVALTGSHALASLALRDDARVQLADGGHVSTRALTIAGQSILDLRDGDLIVVTTPDTRDAMLAAVTAAVRSAREAVPRWSGPGITSSTALTKPLTGVGVISGSPDADSIWVKWVYNGDANFDGRVNADDYFRIDQAFLAQSPNPIYGQGDFNYDGTVNADDYFMIDQAFLAQTVAPLSASAPQASSPLSSIVADQTEPKRTRTTHVRCDVGLFNGVRRVTRSAR